MVRFKLEDTLIKAMSTAKGLKSGAMVTEFMCIVAICRTARFKALVFTNGLMADITLEILSMLKCMDMVNCLGQTVMV